MSTDDLYPFLRTQQVRKPKYDEDALKERFIHHLKLLRFKQPSHEDLQAVLDARATLKIERGLTDREAADVYPMPPLFVRDVSLGPAEVRRIQKRVTCLARGQTVPVNPFGDLRPEEAHKLKSVQDGGVFTPICDPVLSQKGNVPTAPQAPTEQGTAP